MLLDSKELGEIANYAIKAARQAGELIINYDRHKLDVKTKVAGDSLESQVVTEVDRLAQEKILDALDPATKRYDLGLLTEESEDDHSRFEKDYFWCIDPLDGTLAFIRSMPGFSVSIALVSREGIPKIGVVYDPVQSNLYHAMYGVGAFFNDKPFQINDSGKGQSLTFVADRSMKEHEWYEDILTGLKTIAADFNHGGVTILQHGGGVMNALWVLEKAPACYFKLPKQEPGGGSFWDFAATACIANEVGGFVGDMFGKTLDFNRSDSVFMNQKGVLYASDEQLAARILDLFVELKSGRY